MFRRRWHSKSSSRWSSAKAPDFPTRPIIRQKRQTSSSHASLNKEMRNSFMRRRSTLSIDDHRAQGRISTRIGWLLGKFWNWPITWLVSSAFYASTIWPYLEYLLLFIYVETSFFCVVRSFIRLLVCLFAFSSRKETIMKPTICIRDCVRCCFCCLRCLLWIMWNIVLCNCKAITLSEILDR